MKHIRSLRTQYLLLIVVAIMLLPLSAIVAALILNVPFEHSKTNTIYQDTIDLENKWHHEASKLDHASSTTITNHLIKFNQKYALASVFWVDNQGQTHYHSPSLSSLPNQWSTAYTIQFMKRSYDGDPFTVVAFIGKQKNQGFMVLQIPRHLINNERDKISTRSTKIYPFLFLMIFFIFMYVSWVFFSRFRRRLLHLQQAMSQAETAGIPAQVEISRKDEIGQLEQSFNKMIDQLKESRIRERNEEELRKQLIMNLSHDLRSPLTAINGHAYSLKNEHLTDQGKKSMSVILNKVNDLSGLIDNLLSYTLLSAKKYPIHLEDADVLRFLRQTLASWYPLFEREQFAISFDIQDKPLIWHADAEGLKRVIDNLLQNVLRHARSGHYIGVCITNQSIVISDHGPGMTEMSSHKGSGIGLTIVSMLLQQMNLDWDIQTSSNGTTITIFENK
ncbi:MAG: two-component sensor histidine kinase [Sporolactobacillus laevolacticus]|jgi:signal transduction histidine kinase|nr:two-component sensor histidine kinase [Sporolactobacillus laevolacticus]